MTLYTSGGATVGTVPIGASGNYSFTNVASGNYYLQFLCAIPGGMGLSPSNVGGDDTIDSDGYLTATFTLTSGEVDMTWDLGWYDSALIMVSPAWQDINMNAIVDGPEFDLAGHPRRDGGFV